MAIATTETRHPGRCPARSSAGWDDWVFGSGPSGRCAGWERPRLSWPSGAVLAMAADVAFVLPLQARWIMWGTWVATAAVATGIGVIRPLVRRLTWNDLAALAERGEPSLGERLTSAVGLLRQRPHGSPELIAAVVDDAADRAGQVDLTRAVSMRGPLAWLMAGGTVAALVVLPAIVKPDPFAHLGKRFLFPWADIDRVGRFAVEVAPGDKVVALGSDVAVSATVHSRFGEAVPRDQAWLEWTGTDGTPNRVKMVAAIETNRRASRLSR